MFGWVDDHGILCFSVRQEERGAIYMFDSAAEFELSGGPLTDEDKAEWVYFIADSFQEFVNELK